MDRVALFAVKGKHPKAEFSHWRRINDAGLFEQALGRIS
jgi:hypothetical protein